MTECWLDYKYSRNSEGQIFQLRQGGHLMESGESGQIGILKFRREAQQRKKISVVLHPYFKL